MYTTPKSLFTAICDEIRTKTGTVEPIAHQDIPLRISEISGGEPEIPDDGKTRLYLDIPDGPRKDIPLYWYQSVSNGVVIDMGDGSEPFTVSSTGYRNTVLSYSESGKYCITMDVVDGFMSFGGSNTTTVIGGSTQNSSAGRANMGYAAMLYKVETGDGVTSVGSSAFHSCYALQSINIPDGVTSVGSSAFHSCYALQSVNIPDGVTSIKSNAFYFCYALQSINIPDGATSVGSSAFQSCYALQSINIPDGVTSVGGSAFQSCAFMKEYIVLPTIPPTLANIYAFYEIPSDCKIFVPDESVSAYKTATNWVTYADYIYPLSERVAT